jgi:mannonate dehydratase
MEGDDNDHPGYSAIGRLFAIGYLKGLRESVYKQGAE